MKITDKILNKDENYSQILNKDENYWKNIK